MTFKGVLPKTPFKYRGRNYYSDDQIRTIARLWAVYRCRYISEVRSIADNYIEEGKEALLALYRCYGVAHENGTLADIDESKMRPVSKAPFNSKPIEYKIPNGVTYLYSIYYLARLLNRTTQVVRKWELSGIIPRTPFKTKRGTRLYTYEQIYCVVKCAAHFNVRKGVSIKDTGFTDAVRRGYNILSDYYGLDDNNMDLIVDTPITSTI
jgi:DNA-binding transcriptional MerR regulator